MRILTASQNRFNSARNSIWLRYCVNQCEKDAQKPTITVIKCIDVRSNVVRFRKKSTHGTNNEQHSYQTLCIQREKKVIEVGNNRVCECASKEKEKTPKIYR